MPLAHHVGGVPQPAQLVSHRGQVQRQPCWLQRFEGSLLPSDMERVLAGEESGSRRSANLKVPDYCDILAPGGWDAPPKLSYLLAVRLVQSDSLAGELLQGGRCHGRVVPGDVVPAQVVGHDEQDVGLASLPVACRQ